MRMKDYVYSIVYVPGKENLMADCLSRLPNPLAVCEDDPWNDFKVALIHDSGLPAIEWKVWENKHLEDKVLLEVVRYMTEGWPKKELLSDECRAFWEIRSELSMEKDIIYRGCRVIPPVGLRSWILELCHEGHFGVVRTKNVVNKSFWLPSVDKAVEKCVCCCSVCSVSDKMLSTLRPPM